jgi:hypothetical protein
LLLSTDDMPSTIANNFVILDSGTLKVNGAAVPTPPNFINTPSVTFTADVHGNVSAISVSSSVWASLTGDLTETQVIPWDGPTIGTKDTGVSRIGVASIAIGNGTTGDFSGSLKLTGLSVQGALTDGFASVGTAGQVLESTVTGVQWTTPASGGTASSLTLSPIVALVGSTDALNPHAPGTYVVKTVGVDAMTIIAPTVTTDDGKVIKVTNGTSASHTITFTGGTLRSGGAGVTTATFGAFPGSSVELMAYQGAWYAMAQNLMASYS